MLNILGLVRKPSTDESSLDRALSDSEGLPDSKTDQPQPAVSSEQEPIKQENSEVPSTEASCECSLRALNHVPKNFSYMSLYQEIHTRWNIHPSKFCDFLSIVISLFCKVGLW
jgi:hypothetical protein